MHGKEAEWIPTKLSELQDVLIKQKIGKPDMDNAIVIAIGGRTGPSS